MSGDAPPFLSTFDGINIEMFMSTFMTRRFEHI
jgi:hypothetical protein